MHRHTSRHRAWLCRHSAPGCVALLLLTACGTGIEVTEHVTDKDVKRAIGQIDNRQPVVTLEPYVDSVPAWKTGKRFWVADKQVRLLFASSRDYGLDTADITGHVLTYQGYETGGIYDNRSTINLLLTDTADGSTYLYRTGKTMPEFSSSFSIPMLIDLDMVDHVARQVAGKDYYIRTGIWYDCESGQMKAGRHFIKVHIDEVLPGNAVMPLRVLFTAVDTGERAMTWLSDNNSVAMQDRSFDALFVATDPHLSHPDINDSTWELITRSSVAEGMTKDECRLSLGAPRHINELPSQGGMREFWYYDGGSYLYFVDGLLQEFRR